MVALETETLILKPRNASATMVEMPLGSHRCFPRRVHSACYLRVYLVKTAKLNILPNSVTAVGGTNSYPEVAVYFSGGGFSNYVSLSPNVWIFDC